MPKVTSFKLSPDEFSEIGKAAFGYAWMGQMDAHFGWAKGYARKIATGKVGVSDARVAEIANMATQRAETLRTRAATLKTWAKKLEG